MTDAWWQLVHGDHWRSGDLVWAEDEREYSWAQVAALAARIEGRIRAAGDVRVVRIRSGSKLGCFAGQLGAWRAGCVAVADDGGLGADELARVRPELTVAVSTGDRASVELVECSQEILPADRIPDEVVAVNFTSGSTGSRKAVAVTQGNLLALLHCRDLDVPVSGRLTAGSFATPSYDGWWFDTWRTISAGGAVVCLPNVNEDVFAWSELTERYRIERLLLPAAVIATLVEAVPECLAGIGWLFSGGEQFRASTYQRARHVGLRARFVNLYGPTEATFATHRYDLPVHFAGSTIPIGKPLHGCYQELRALGPRADEGRELVVTGPLVCLGYLEHGSLAHRFESDDGHPLYATGDVVRVDGGGDLVFAGRLDNQIKVNGSRVDAAALEHHVTGMAKVLDCRVTQDEHRTVAFVLAGAESVIDHTVRTQIEAVVKTFSPAIAVQLVDRFPVKSGGKVDTASLMNQPPVTSEGGER